MSKNTRREAPKLTHKDLCDPRGTGRHDQKCSDCQNKLRRAVKRRRMFFRAGPYPWKGEQE